MNEKEQVAAAQAMRQVQDTIGGAQFAERQKLMAELAFSKYRALVKAGFTEVQAMYLIGVSPY